MFSRLFGKGSTNINAQDEAKTHFKIANEYLSKDDYDNAINEFTIGLEINPCPKAYIDRGLSYTSKNQHDKAITDYKSSLKIDQKSDQSIAYLLLGVSLFKLDQYEDSIISLTKIITGNFEDKIKRLAYIHRVSSYLKLEKYDKVIDDYTQAISISSFDNLDIYNNLSSSIAPMIATLDIYNKRGDTYNLIGDFVKAIEDFSFVIQHRPDDSYAFCGRGLAYFGSGLKDQALQDLRKACNMGDKGAEKLLIDLDLMKNDVVSLDKNSILWHDKESLDIFTSTVHRLGNIMSSDNVDPKSILSEANKLDDLMQSYEKRYGPIEDPLFFWWFATANALFMQIGNKLDPELGTVRIAYVMNGYKEGLNKHLLYPSYTNLMMDVIFENMEQFANEHDKVWISNNRHKFVPLPE